VSWHQTRSPLLALLPAAALACDFVGERSDAIALGVIGALSVGEGFVNEDQGEKARRVAVRSHPPHTLVIGDEQTTAVDVTEVVAAT